MFSIDEPQYYCFAITKPITHFPVIFSHFNIHFIKDINNLIFQRTKKFIYFISTLFRLLYRPALCMSDTATHLSIYLTNICRSFEN